MPTEEEAIARIYRYRRDMAGALLALFLVTFVFFIVLWGVAVVNTHSNFLETLSWMLATNDDAKLMYIIWFVFYTVLNLIFMFSVLMCDMSVIENSHEGKTNKTMYCSLRLKRWTYVSVTLLYIPLTFLKIFGFLMLWNYPLDEHGNIHYAWTAVALVSSIVASFLLFLRRFANRHYIHVTPWVGVILSANFIVVVAQVVLVSVFAAQSSSRGATEFALAIVIGLDPIFQITDVYHDMNCRDTLALDAEHILHKDMLNYSRLPEDVPDTGPDALTISLKENLIPVVSRRLIPAHIHT